MFIAKIADSTPYRDGDPFYQTTPVEIDAAVRAICRELGDLEAAFIPVSPVLGAVKGMCHDNVTEQIERCGGGRAFGWAIWVCELFALAEFQEVWVSLAGEFVDVTPADQGETSVAFAVDGRYPPDFDIMQHPPNHMMRIIERSWNTDVSELIGKLSPAQRAYEETRAKRTGQDVASHLLAKIPKSLLATTLDDLLDATAARERLVLRTNQGDFSPDPKAQRVAASRVCELEDLVETLYAEMPRPSVPGY